MADKYLGKYIIWQGKIAKITGTTSGQDTVTIDVIEGKQCPHCGGRVDYRVSVIPDSPYFRASAFPVETIADLHTSTPPHLHTSSMTSDGDSYDPNQGV